MALNWSVQGATTLTFDPGGIDVFGQTRRVVTPTVDTTYTLTATNPAGTTQATVLVQAGAGPVINSFSVADANPLYGAETALAWNITGATSLSINNGIGPVSGAIGSVAIEPLLQTTYTITATNFYGSAQASALVSQATPIGVTTAGYTVRRVNSNTPFPFAGQGYLQSADSLLAGQNAIAASDITVTGVSSINYANGADGDFTSGNLDFPGGGGGDNFAVKATATLVVNTPGVYSFVINTDDGGRLRIDGQDVIVDDGTHSPSSNSGRVTLDQANSSIRVHLLRHCRGARRWS